MIFSSIIILVELILFFFFREMAKKNKIQIDQESIKDYDYNEYNMGWYEKIQHFIFAAMLLYIVGYIFYRNPILSLLLSIFALKYPKMKKKNIIEQQKNILQLQFKEALYSIYTAISSGSSPTNSIIGSIEDLQRLFPDDSFIISELKLIDYRVSFNDTIENALRDFSRRSHLEDVENFCDVFIMSMSTGGKQVEIIKNTINTIMEKIEIKREIAGMVAEKKNESKIMLFMPIMIVLFLSSIGGGYMDPLFETILGNIVTTIVLGLLYVCYVVSVKVTTIEV